MQVEQAPTVVPCALQAREASPPITVSAAWVVVALVVCALSGLGFYFWHRPPTQLELYNIGDKPLLVQRGADAGKVEPVVVAPGGTFRAPFVAGDALRLAPAGATASVSETLVTLEFRDATASDPPRVIAEAFADASGSVVFSYAESVAEAEGLSHAAALRDAFAPSSNTPRNVTVSAAGAGKSGPTFQAETRAKEDGE